MATRVLWLTKGLGPGGTERLLVEMARARDPVRLEPTVAYVLPWKDHLAGELEAAGVDNGVPVDAAPRPVAGRSGSDG